MSGFLIYCVLNTYVSVFAFIHHCLYNSKVKLFKLMVLNPCLLTKHFFGLFTTPFSLTLVLVTNLRKMDGKMDKV